MNRIQSTKSTLVTLGLVAALMVLAAGCNSGTEEPAAPAPEMPTPSETPSASSGTDDAAAPTPFPKTEIDDSRFPKELPPGVAAEIPTNFPSELPVYPNAAPAQGRGGNVDGKEFSAVQLVSNDTPSEARSFYERELASKGWSIDKAEDRGVASSIAASRGGCKVSIMITPAEGGGSDIFNVSECDE